jgi:hypothetical protein
VTHYRSAVVLEQTFKPVMPALQITTSPKYIYLPTESLTYLGHDYNYRFVSIVAQESKLNPHLIAKTKAEFIDFMASLNLPNPNKSIWLSLLINMPSPH